MSLRLAESQTLFEALNDPLLRPALEAFVQQQKEFLTEQLLGSVRSKERDTMRDSRFAGLIEAYEDLLRDLEHFAKEQLEKASQ